MSARYIPQTPLSIIAVSIAGVLVGTVLCSVAAGAVFLTLMIPDMGIAEALGSILEAILYVILNVGLGLIYGTYGLALLPPVLLITIVIALRRRTINHRAASPRAEPTTAN